MKNVIYINCWIDPWLKVAQTLKEQYGYNPVWWIGYSKEDNSHVLIPQQFPGIVYQDNADAWKGRFPEEVQERAASCYLDVDFLNRHANHELQAMRMMDRVDQDQHSFNFMERQRHFRNMIKQWMAVIELVKPDLIISTAIPHRLYDYVLYWLCEERGIPFLTIQHTQFPGRFYFSKNGFYTLGNRFIDDWHSFEKCLDVKKNIPDDVLSRYEKVNMDYEQGAPFFMKKMSDRERQSGTMLAKMQRFFRKIHWFTPERISYVFGKPCDNTIIGLSAYAKRRNRKYEDSDGNIYQNKWAVYKASRYLDKLKKDYESLTTPPNYDENYVVLFLHYQPEATSCPGGDIFVDQRLCIELLLKYLPSNYKVYVKEHPHQLSKLKDGYTARMRDLYDDLLKNDRVKLISLGVKSFDLIDNAKAVATLTGTAGWEAMVRHKPVIAFGLCWYENYVRGVLRVTNEESAKDMYKFIGEYQFDEHSLLSYLASVGKGTYVADYFKRNRTGVLTISKEENVNGVVKAILEHVQ